MQTINDIIADYRGQFLRLSTSRQSTIRRRAQEYIRRNPGCADHSTFWRGLSARQVLSTYVHR